METNGEFSIPFPEWVPNRDLLGERMIITWNRSFVCAQDPVNRIWTYSNISSGTNPAYFECSEHEAPPADVATESKTNSAYKNATNQK